MQYHSFVVSHYWSLYLIICLERMITVHVFKGSHHLAAHRMSSSLLYEFIC